ncbi:Class II flagellar assembly regulator [Maricaulis salignorans]|uniref:Class II flagellar assembly regulator n=2 Tax=Maricaulis salignorans TaxID=144026 RepID=A0A1G9VGT9_9PROT|nr:Class II flagellar assembly regulator [Maricaulis salignorans]
MTGVSSVDAILALQSVGDFNEARKQATGRAMELLDVLDELKLALLEGGLPKAKLVALMSLLQTRRDDTNDAGLEAALDEVEIRAAVELAKFG